MTDLNMVMVHSPIFNKKIIHPQIMFRDKFRLWNLQFSSHWVCGCLIVLCETVKNVTVPRYHIQWYVEMWLNVTNAWSHTISSFKKCQCLRVIPGNRFLGLCECGRSVKAAAESLICVWWVRSSAPIPQLSFWETAYTATLFSHVRRISGASQHYHSPHQGGFATVSPFLLR